MKYYMGDRFLFIDMNQLYTHCVVEGEDRVICCQKSQTEANSVCFNIKSEKQKRITELKMLLETGHAYASEKKTAYGIDPRELYPTAGLLSAAIRRMEKNMASVRVCVLRMEP